MRTISNILFLFVAAIACSSYSEVKVDYKFAVSLKPHWPQNLTTFAVVKEYKGEVIDSYKCDSRNFMLMASGMMRCDANPDKINYFEKFEIPYCEGVYDEVFTVHVVDCPILDNLWKLRYQKVPGNLSESNVESAGESGWAKKKLNPDEYQFGMLSQFGISSLDDWAKGDDCFRLIKATTDMSWVMRYSE